MVDPVLLFFVYGSIKALHLTAWNYVQTRISANRLDCFVSSWLRPEETGLARSLEFFPNIITIASSCIDTVIDGFHAIVTNHFPLHTKRFDQRPEILASIQQVKVTNCDNGDIYGF